MYLKWVKILSKSSPLCQNCTHFFYFSSNLTEFSNIFWKNINIQAKKAIFIFKSYSKFNVVVINKSYLTLGKLTNTPRFFNWNGKAPPKPNLLGKIMTRTEGVAVGCHSDT